MPEVRRAALTRLKKHFDVKERPEDVERAIDAALAIEPSTEVEEKMLGGMRSTYQQLIDVVSKEGLEPIPAVGEPFDPEVHEAVATESSTAFCSHSCCCGFSDSHT